MAITLEANYAKKLGLPNYSSHQYCVTIRTELTDLSQVAEESARLYRLLQDAVDHEIQEVGFMPDASRYGMNNGSPVPTNGHPGNGNGQHTNGNGNSNGSYGSANGTRRASLARPRPPGATRPSGMARDGFPARRLPHRRARPPIATAAGASSARAASPATRSRIATGPGASPAPRACGSDVAQRSFC